MSYVKLNVSNAFEELECICCLKMKKSCLMWEFARKLLKKNEKKLSIAFVKCKLSFELTVMHLICVLACKVLYPIE